jgi:hypothetical protein
VIPAVLRKFALTGIDRVVPSFADLDEALEPAPPHPGDRPATDPGASPSPA